MKKETKELLNKHNIKFVTLSNLSGIFIISKYSVNHISVAENMVELLNNDLLDISNQSDSEIGKGFTMFVVSRYPDYDSLMNKKTDDVWPQIHKLAEEYAEIMRDTPTPKKENTLQNLVKHIHNCYGIDHYSNPEQIVKDFLKSNPPIKE